MARAASSRPESEKHPGKNRDVRIVSYAMPTHPGDEYTFDRAHLLRLGAATVAGSALLAVPARAAVPTPSPQGDDIAYVQFAATAELVSISLGARLVRSSAFTAGERRRLRALRAGDKEHFARLAAVLGPDAPQYGDFHIEVPTAGTDPRGKLLKLALELGTLIAGVYLSGVSDATDPATRGLLGRLLWSEAQHLSTVRTIAGHPAAASGLPGPVSVDDAAPRLDAFLGDAEPPA